MIASVQIGTVILGGLVSAQTGSGVLDRVQSKTSYNHQHGSVEMPGFFFFSLNGGLQSASALVYISAQL